MTTTKLPPAPEGYEWRRPSHDYNLHRKGAYQWCAWIDPSAAEAGIAPTECHLNRTVEGHQFCIDAITAAKQWLEEQKLPPKVEGYKWRSRDCCPWYLMRDDSSPGWVVCLPDSKDDKPQIFGTHTVEQVERLLQAIKDMQKWIKEQGE